MPNRIPRQFHAAVFSWPTRFFLSVLIGFAMGVTTVPCGAPKRQFTVADDIGVSYFGIPMGFSNLEDGITFSPDGKYFVVVTERGVVEKNQVEATLRVYRTQDVKTFLEGPEHTQQPSPFWLISRAAFDHARFDSVVSAVRWLADSQRFAFLTSSASGNRQLVLADVKAKTVRALTSTDQDVDNFDIRDEEHFAYYAMSRKLLKRTVAENEAGWAVGTGRAIQALMFPEEAARGDGASIDLVELWAVVDNRRFRVEDRSSGRPLPLHSHYQTWFALSPDGRTVVAPMVVRTVPDSWATLFPPPIASDPYASKGGQQDPEALEAWTMISEWASIDLLSGEVKSLTHAPTGMSRGWWGSDVASWSADGKSIVLSNTFVPSEETGGNEQRRPCMAAIVEIVTNQLTCLSHLESDGKRHYFNTHVRFAPDGNQDITVDYEIPFGSTTATNTTIYSRKSDKFWKVVFTRKDSISESRPLNLSVEQDLNQPPILVGTNNATRISRVILDPNPQLKDIALSDASVFRWKDDTGRTWAGGLYKPPDYILGRRYPLVVQPYAFYEHRFTPSGLVPTVFAARELAAAGIVVLQVGETACEHGTPDEGPCRVAGYDSGVRQLVSEGVVDPFRVGIVGFSRSCYSALVALTTGKIHYSAASIMDGIDMGYFQYLTHLDQSPDNGVEREFEKVNGGTPPFGEGFHQWLQRAPDFHLEKLTTPLRIVANGHANLLEEWEPYAALRLMKKPVDLILLTRRGTHVTSNPGQRLISQGGTVDWMRFWLKGEEDPDPGKGEQYSRWRELRSLQEKSEGKLKEPRK